jgi:type IV pilus assembly protein PilE
MSYRTYMKKAQAGFTLIELMITLAIVAILASIAVPAYTGYIARAYRADARAVLLQAAQYMQRFNSANDRFDINRSSASVYSIMPANMKQSPSDGNAIYTLVDTPSDITASTFILEMRPSSTGPMAADGCGSFTITESGVRGVKIGGAAGSSTVRDGCWK